MFNPVNLFKLKGLWERFSKNHPKLLPWAQAVYPKTIREGTVIDCTVTTPDGRKIATNLKLSADDMEVIHELETVFNTKGTDETP
jgi:hypothetical protein